MRAETPQASTFVPEELLSQAETLPPTGRLAAAPNSPAGSDLGPPGSSKGATLADPLNPDSLIGHKLKGKYRILQRIGKGTFGAAYLAEQLSVNRQVVIKVPSQELAIEHLPGFLNEAKTMARLNHQNIVQLHDFDYLPDGKPFLVMQWGGDINLKEEIEARRRLPEEEVMSLGIQLCDALSAAHAQGVLHRDLKPANILILRRKGEPDRAMVCDLGIAKIAGSEMLGSTLVDQTEPGRATGTPRYASPEQGRGESLDRRSDLYSLGVCLYEALCGAPPIMAATPKSYVVAHRNQEPAPPEHYGVNLHSAVKRVVFRALAKDPNDRFQTAHEMRLALEAALQELKGPAPTSAATAAVPPAGAIATLAPLHTAAAAVPKATTVRPAAAVTVTAWATWSVLGVFLAAAVALAAWAKWWPPESTDRVVAKPSDVVPSQAADLPETPRAEPAPVQNTPPSTSEQHHVSAGQAATTVRTEVSVDPPRKRQTHVPASRKTASRQTHALPHANVSDTASSSHARASLPPEAALLGTLSFQVPGPSGVAVPAIEVRGIGGKKIQLDGYEVSASWTHASREGVDLLLVATPEPKDSSVDDQEAAKTPTISMFSKKHAKVRFSIDGTEHVLLIFFTPKQ